MLTRLPDWPARLQSFVSANHKQPFSYGSWDCALFVGGAIEAMTGTDMAAWFRNRYHSRREARALMRERMGTSNPTLFFPLMAEAFNMAEVPVRLAHRGDAVLVKREGRYSVGIVALDGQRIILAGETCTGVQGLGFVGLDCGLRAWRV